jgi:hypothetical protein
VVSEVESIRGRFRFQLFHCELVRQPAGASAKEGDGEKWRFKRITIDNAWAQGDPEILTALATQNVLRTKAKRR